MEISVTLIMLFQLHYVFLIDTHNSSTKCNHIFSEKKKNHTGCLYQFSLCFYIVVVRTRILYSK
jgi:hypothetical protein